MFAYTKNAECAKRHTSKDGKIPENLIGNLRSLLQTEGPSFIGAIQMANKEQYFGRFETRLIGFERGANRVFTHRIFDDDVQELDVEDLARLAPISTSNAE